MMKAIIFIGPTISIEQARTHLDAVYLPPVRYGDVFRVVELYQPRQIGIIDGYFNQVPAVWHKEILWAMNQNCDVFGASSMGALRACELEQMGMVGIGKIFDAYKRNVLPPYVDEPFEDDDEVAVTHGPGELGYQPLSEAMVNIRYTLAKAQQHQIIDLDTRNGLINIAKTLFYPERTYSQILNLALENGIKDDVTQRLTDWIKQHKVDQKKNDAITLLSKINEQQGLQNDKQQSSPQTFRHTSQWQTAINEIEQSHRLNDAALDELRLLGPTFLALTDKALKSVSVSQPDQQRVDPDSLSALHQEPQMLEQCMTSHWLQLSNQSLGLQFSDNQCDQLLLNYLETTGELQGFEQRAKTKAEQLADLKLPPIYELTEIDLLQLSDWYFSTHLELDLPDDLETYAAQLRFEDLDSFYAMILREYYYQEKLKHNGN